MSDSIVLRPARIDDAWALATTIIAAFEQYRGKLVPESGAFRETPEGIARELMQDTGGIIAERNGSVVGCVMFRVYEGDLYFGRLSVLPEVRGLGLSKRLIAAVEREARMIVGALEKRLGANAPPRIDAPAAAAKDAELRAAMESLGAENSDAGNA